MERMRRHWDANTRVWELPRGWSVSLVCASVLAISGLVASAAQAATVASDWSTLVSDVAAGGAVQLGADITASSGANLVVGGTAVTLDLNGHALTITSPASDAAAIQVPQGDSLTIIDSSGGSGSLTAAGGAYAAGIGGDGLDAVGNGQSSGSITIAGGTVQATGGLSAPGIGGGTGSGVGGNAGPITISGGSVTALGGSQGSGIGGGAGNNAGGTTGTITITGGTVHATGTVGPGIGGGVGVNDDGGSLGTLVVQGGSVTATSQSDGPAIGGSASNGTPGNGGTVDIEGGSVDAVGSVTGIGSGAGLGSVKGAGAAITIAAGASLTATAGGSVINDDSNSSSFGSLTNAGTLTVPAGQTLAVPSGDTIVNQSTGTLDIQGSLTGQGTVINRGLIQAGGSIVDNGNGDGVTGLMITPHNYELSFDLNGGSGGVPSTEYVYAGSLSAAGQSLPGSPALPAAANSFTGWYSAASGGTQVQSATSLEGLYGTGPVAETLYAQYTGPVTLGTQPASVSDPFGGSASFSASASGWPAPTVQWQSSTDSGASWQNVSGATATTLTVPNLTTSQSGTEYRAVFTNSTSSATTGAATLTVTPQSQAITFDPLSAGAAAGTTAQLSASGGGSGQPVLFSVGAGTSPAGACTVAQTGSGTGTVTYVHAGTCEVDATQAASTDGNYTAAPAAVQTVSVADQASTVTLSTPTTVAFGQAATVTAVVGEHDGSVAGGLVQFTVNGQDLGSPVTLAAGRATSPDLTAGLAPGSYLVGATFVPSDTTVYAGAAASSVSQVVEQAATSTAVTVGTGTLAATVSAVAPGAGTPTGSVDFKVDGTSVGSASLAGGTATITETLPSGAGRTVTAVYSGDSDFTGSSASIGAGVAAAPTTTTVRVANPSLTAWISSVSPKSRYGWYDAPVTVHFSCETHGSPLKRPCPSPVTLSRSGAAQSLTRTVTAVNGGVATVAIRGINIDRGRPHVRISRAPAPAGDAAAGAKCVGSDALSGLARCVLRRQVMHETTGLDYTIVTLTATATDRAGNDAVATSTYRAPGIYVEGATYRGGAFQVPAGRSSTIVVSASTSAPRYVDAAPNPPGPQGLDNLFHPIGHGAWAIGVVFGAKLGSQHAWQFGVLIGGTMHVVNVHTT